MRHVDRRRAASRATRYRDGLVRYTFHNHILIFGGGMMVVELVDALASRQEFAGRQLVITTQGDAGQMRRLLEERLAEAASTMDITVYRGHRGSEAELRASGIEQASHIFIVGEDDEDGHDALNVDCWQKVMRLRQHSPHVAQCILYVDLDATIQLIHKLPQEAHTSVETTLVSRQQLLVQQLLMGDSPQGVSHTLDRGLISPESDRYVHLVVVGMTSIGCTFATTAAQFCHFPNFDESSPHPLRTKITFVDPEAYRKMCRFKSLHPMLFSLSHSRYYSDETSWLQGRPDSRYGDFMDVEWQFVKGTIDEEWVRALLVSCAEDPKQVLSVAFCSQNADENYVQSLHLPQQLYVSGASQGTTPPNIYVYQPSSGSLLRAAQTEVMQLGNLVPFGEWGRGCDPLMVRQTAVAKRVNYLRQKETSGKAFESMPTDAVLLDSLWQQISLSEKMSNICSATAVYTQMRCLGLETAEGCAPLDDAEVLERFIRVEQARWNMEKVLAGFGAQPADEHKALNAALQSDNNEEREEARTMVNRNANLRHLLKDIAPYATLAESRQEEIRSLVRNLPLAALPYIMEVKGEQDK